VPLYKLALVSLGSALLGWKIGRSAGARRRRRSRADTERCAHPSTSCCGSTIVANGSEIIIATDHSIVYRGDRGRISANTGDAADGGIVAIDSATSHFSTLLRSEGGAPGPGARGAEEDHSVAVFGNENIASSDDSVIVMDRDGAVNANTGDVDSGALNAVSTRNSDISTSEQPDEDHHCDAAAPMGDDQGPDEHVDDDRAEDGLTNNSLRIVGHRNVVVEDDGVVVVGGRGLVNAQVGDSDTGGVLAMDTTDSTLRSNV
jgi:hypothetical protein